MRLRRRGILLCLLDNSFSSKKQPVKDGEATEGYVLDRPLSLMNIIRQANIYITVCGIHTFSSIYAIYRESLYFKLIPYTKLS